MQKGKETFLPLFSESISFRKLTIFFSVLLKLISTFLGEIGQFYSSEVFIIRAWSHLFEI